ncbi:hypothetical protein [Agrococcus sp. SCSIO52902]|uniref:hypothetical protein n=1 Tax=Agrococcus sp. SCSIO52902 TaxID=2933290 RepID=UPI001FF44190|nr:hypothetical protein [Agrococcus sp. SCSIO52902]UOV99894.1 hypothetical protein MU522_08015 [Agrococcus sp. SCSIO52902]
MTSSHRLAVLAVAALMLTGCAAATADPGAAPAPTTATSPEASHTMPDGSVMPGSEHGEHGAHGSTDASGGPSEAAAMVCGGQVETAIASQLRLDDLEPPATAWDAPDFTCTYDVDGAPLVLSVHDATDPAIGEAHFAELQGSLPGAEEIDGMLGLGLPSFSTGDGVVAFLRDGKTLLVDATGLPEQLADGTMTQSEVAYAVASSVLVCWVEHD